MSYKTKYLKYKTKYLKYKKLLSGGTRQIPVEPQTNNSWLFMPIILRPFYDVNIVFPVEFNTICAMLHDDANFKTLDEINIILTQFYIDLGINLNDRTSLVRLGYIFNDRDNLHLTQSSQEQLLNDAGITIDVEAITASIIHHLGGNVTFTFEALH